MNKQLENLSKDLASGVSRRKAMWKFAAGLTGIAGLGLLATKKASASPAVDEAVEECLEQTDLIFESCYIGCLQAGGKSVACEDGCLGEEEEWVYFCYSMLGGGI